MPKILWKPGHDGDEHIVELASSKDFFHLGAYYNEIDS